MSTLSDVAKIAGVSVSAVSRVLSDAPSTRVSDATRERIHSAAKQLSYRPNFAGRALKFAKSNVIALIVPDLTNAVFTELMQGVEDGAIDRDYTVLLGRSETMQPGGEMIAKLIGEGRVDGILLQLNDTAAVQDVSEMLSSSAPVVFVNSTKQGHVGSVVLDDDRGVRVAVEHLTGLGHTDIALIGGGITVPTAVRRERGFRAAMADAQLPVRPEWVTSVGFSPANGREALRRLWGLATRPTAVVVANVNAAIGALGEARTLGLQIPEDLSVVAVHDAWTAENTWPPLTTVKMPLRELGRQAVESVYLQLQGGERSDIVVDDPAPLLMVRESTVRLVL